MLVPTLGCALVCAFRSGWRPASLGVALAAVVLFAILLTIVVVPPTWVEGLLMTETWLAQLPGWRGMISYCLDALFLCAGPMAVFDRLDLAAAVARCSSETKGMRFDWLAPVQWSIAALWTMAVIVTVSAPLPFVMHQRLARSFAATRRVAAT
jgi:hypothetical protein